MLGRCVQDTIAFYTDRTLSSRNREPIFYLHDGPYEDFVIQFSWWRVRAPAVSLDAYRCRSYADNVWGEMPIHPTLKFWITHFTGERT